MDKEKRTLLIVDSSATTLFYLGMLLKNLGYIVHTSTTAEDALKTMADFIPSLVIMDIALPRMNGVDLLRQMKQNLRLETVPVIVHTAKTDPVIKETCTTAGCVGYFNKPVDAEVLYRAIQSAIEAPRQYIRIDTLLKAEINEASGVDGASRTEDVTTISEGGLYIKTLANVPVGTVLSLRLYVGDRIIASKAIVLYSSGKIGGQHKVPGMGMQFQDISPEDRAFLRDFIKGQVTKNLKPKKN